jgi:hypothetical protein
MKCVGQFQLNILAREKEIAYNANVEYMKTTLSYKNECGNYALTYVNS